MSISKSNVEQMFYLFITKTKFFENLFEANTCIATIIKNQPVTITAQLRKSGIAISLDTHRNDIDKSPYSILHTGRWLSCKGCTYCQIIHVRAALQLFCKACK